MNRVLLSGFTVLLCVAAQAKITTFPYAEGFENNGTNLPVDWTLEQVAEAGDGGATKTWEISNAGNWNFSPQSTHGGNYKAALGTDYMGGSVARLVTPSLDLTSVADPQIKFWRTQSNFIGVNQLKVYYKTSASGEWRLLETFAAAVEDWTQATLDLPEPSADYYIAFEGYDMVGFGVQLDDIRVAAAPTGPVIGESETSLNMGVVYNNLPTETYTAVYSVKNTGVKDLVVESLGEGTSPNLAADGLPLTVKPGEQGTMTVRLSGTNAMEQGFFNGKLVLSSNDDTAPEFTVDVTATVSVAEISSYLYTNLGSDMQAMFPSDWTITSSVGFARFMPSIDSGIDNSTCMTSMIGSNGWDQLETGFIFMGANPKLSFNYKLLQQSPTGFDFDTPVPTDKFVYEVSISKDNGATWNKLQLTPAAHPADAAGFNEVSADASDYAGEICKVRFYFKTVGTINNPRLYVDDFTIGTAPVNDLEAVAVAGSATPTALVENDYTVQVKNLGSADQEGFAVRLMQKTDGGDIEIGLQNVANISAGQTLDVPFKWTPLNEGPAKLYGEIVIDDEYALNNLTPIVAVDVQPGSYKTVKVGDGTGEGNYFLPYNTYYMQSLTQTLYFPHELKTNSGQLRSLTYNAHIEKGVVDLHNLPIQIWIGETEKDNLADGWVDPATLTCVFDGNIDFPVGNYDVTVHFDTPYEYKGGNLVVYSFRKKVAEGAYGNMNNRFKSTNFPGSARSRLNYLIDDVVFDPMRPDEIEIVMPVDFIPDTNFVFDFSGTGSLTGSVADETGGLDNATVKVGGSDLYVMAGSDGKYQFPALRPGNYSMTADRHGYFSETRDVEVSADQTATLDFTLRPIPTYTVSGKVTSPDCPGGVSGITVALSGYHDYTATTDADGKYVIEGVYDGFTYDVKVRDSLYDDYDATISVADGDAFCNIELKETAYPVFSAKAEKEADNVVVVWESPVAGRNVTYTIDDNTPESGERVNPGNDVRMGNKFETTDEGVLRSVSILGLANPRVTDNDEPLTVEIYNSNRELIGTSDPFRLPADAWVNVPLDNIRYSGSFYVMVRWQNLTGQTNRMATDTNGFYAGERLSWAFANGSWTDMYDAFRIHCVFMIRPNALFPDENATATPESYRLFRLPKGSESETESWTELASTSDLSYVDESWSALAEGSYRYAVRAEYAGENNVSEAVFTKSLSAGKAGVVAVADDLKLKVFPNPVRDIMYIYTDAEISEVSVIDLSGRVVVRQSGANNQVALGMLPSGCYVARIATSAGVRTVKIVKE